MGHGERRHDRYERAKLPQWDDQTKQEQQMIGPIQNVSETHLHESPRRLVPARIETNDSGIPTFIFKSANLPVRRKKSQNRDHTQPQLFKTRMEGEPRHIRLNRILEQRIEHALRGKQLRV